MSGSLGLSIAVGAGWLAIGLVLSVVMGRRGHNSFGWLVLGTLLGPLALVLAFDARRHSEHLEPIFLGRQVPSGGGPVDVLVGYDGSPESVEAIDAVVELLGERLGRLTVATVVAFGDIRMAERLAKGGLQRLAERTPGRRLDLEVLHGSPAAALQEHALEGGYELLVAGTRGQGISKAILGSVAAQLARNSKVPVLLAGGHRA